LSQERRCQNIGSLSPAAYLSDYAADLSREPTTANGGRSLLAKPKVSLREREKRLRVSAGIKGFFEEA